MPLRTSVSKLHKHRQKQQQKTHEIQTAGSTGVCEPV